MRPEYDQGWVVYTKSNFNGQCQGYGGGGNGGYFGNNYNGNFYGNNNGGSYYGNNYGGNYYGNGGNYYGNGGNFYGDNRYPGGNGVAGGGLIGNAMHKKLPECIITSSHAAAWTNKG